VISIVCVYNNTNLLDTYLLKSLNCQKTGYELILVDNITQQYNSAAEALNYGGKLAKNEYLMFIHQDVNLLSDTWLERAESLLQSLPNLGVAGVAGKQDYPDLLENIRNGIPPVLSNLKHGTPPSYPGVHITDPVKVQTLDECLIIIPRSVFTQLQFDESTCDNWHLYAVDYCLSCKKLGYEVYLMPFTVYHRSTGFSLSEEYYVTLKKLLSKHKEDYWEVYTTMGDWLTFCSIPLQRNIIWKSLRRCIFIFTGILYSGKYNSLPKISSIHK